MSTYRTVEGDTVDLIAWRHYGDEALAAVIFDANPGLADLGAVLPTGTLVRLPDRADAPPPAGTGRVHLWD